MDDETLAELRENFDHFDADDNGAIDVEEFTYLLETLKAGMSRVEIHTGFHAIDTDGNGRIDFDEFCAWWGDR